MANGNGSMDPADIYPRLLVLQDDFQACRARSVQKGEEQVELLHNIQQEIVRFETDVADKMVKLQEGITQILEHITKPKKKKAKAHT
jgi:hypothetical protein